MKNLYYPFFLFLFINIHLSISQNVDKQIIKDYLLEEGYKFNQINDIQIQSSSYSNSLKGHNVYINQTINGIPIRNNVGSIFIKDGTVKYFTGNFIKNNDLKSIENDPVISPSDAYIKASEYFNLGIPKIGEVIETNRNSSYKITKSSGAQGEIPIKLVYELINDQLVLSWDLSIHTEDGSHWYSIRVNARSAEIVSHNDWILECSFDKPSSISEHQIHKSVLELKENNSFNSLMNPSYNVFPIPAIESPNHGSRQLISGQENLNASPFGWHDTDGVEGPEFTTTRGNNVIASEDFNGNNGIGYMPDGGTDLIFNYEYSGDALVENNEDASITNLFYANNVIHDVWYEYGFDEASGNFQFNNYGKGGEDGDEVSADALDGSGTNNATFGTPPDGSNPKMSMFLWNPQVDPSIQAFVVNNSSLAGSYNIVDNSFSPGQVDAPIAPDAITADLVLAIDDDASIDVNDICSDLINASDLVDKIAVVRRGECNFTDKVIRCQDAGALAVLVVNNVSDAPIPMGGGNEFITIPAVMINQEDGENLITEMQSSVINVSLSDAGKKVFAEDGSFDNGIVIHEYGHGISTRLTGGALNSGCLSNAEQMGEGWSDWFALMMTIEGGDSGSDPRGIGTYAIGQPTTGGGIRPFPYSTDRNINPVTYGDTNNDANFSVPHGVGSIWASILWDMTWAFIERDGFDPDLYNGNGGNNLAMQLVIDGLKLQSCDPGFIDGRDGILMAAESTENSQDNICLIWDVFAKRGLGYSAEQGSSNSRLDQVEAFDFPPVEVASCGVLSVDEFNQEEVIRISPNPSNGSFIINVPDELNDIKLSIFDINGRLVYKEELSINNSYNFDSGLNSGMYLLRIESDQKETYTTKIIVR